MPSRDKTVDLDPFDRAILDVLQEDNTVPHRKIAERVNLSPAAVSRRIRRLNDSGAVLANVAVVDPAILGKPLMIIVEVDMADERLDLLESARRSFAEDPDVRQCYYVTGDVDFVLIVSVASMSAYEALTRRLFFGNKNVKRFRTLVVMDPVKAGRSSVPTGLR
jgi:Lrp/AsnC family leucine-responsive transcriptional regulator